LTSVVSGLAPLRNKMSDAHARTFRPARHHAKLAVNAAKTAVDFVLETFEYQRQRGSITVKGDATAMACDCTPRRGGVPPIDQSSVRPSKR
jgi:hypothetical protein